MDKVLTRYRQSVNPPWNLKDYFNLVATFAILLSIPLVMAMTQSQQTIESQAQTGAVLAVTPIIANAGTHVAPGWSGVGNSTPNDWLGLYAQGDPDTAPRARFYNSWATIEIPCPSIPETAQSAGSCIFPITFSTPDGTYELRLFSNDSYTKLATSNTFIVTRVQVTATASTLNVGETTTVSWQNQARSSYKDWFGLFAQSASNQERIDWMYVSCSKTPFSDVRSGSCSFQIPQTLVNGTYEFRFFEGETDTDPRFGLRMIGKSNSITIGGGVTPSSTPTPTSIFTPTPTGIGTSFPEATPTISTKATITGTITSSVGKVVSGAKITLRVNNKNVTYTSDAQGKYIIPNLPPGTYSITYVAAGYSQQKTTATVTAGQTLVINVTLKPK